MLDDDSAQHVALVGDLSGLTVIRSENEDASAIVGDDIDAGLTGDDVLQLWAIRDGVPTSMGTFTPDAEGHVAAVMEGLVEPPDTIYAVTIEPAGGSPQPTSDPVAASPPDRRYLVTLRLKAAIWSPPFSISRRR